MCVVLRLLLGNPAKFILFSLNLTIYYVIKEQTNHSQMHNEIKKDNLESRNQKWQKEQK